ncbi:MAG: phosphatase PAP2 family protein [Chloroflexota bacterium]
MGRKRGQVLPLPAVLAVGIGASLGSVFLFGKLADEILENETMALDTRLVEEARETRSPALDKTMSAATALGEPWALGAVGVLIGVDWLVQNRKADLITWASALVGGGLLNELLKRRFHRARPALKLRRAHATGYSFPSGHAMMTLSTYGTLAYLVSRRGTLTKHPAASLVWAPVLLLSALVGSSRVYLEVHYPTDVLAGWAAAIVWASTCSTARNFMEPEES